MGLDGITAAEMAGVGIEGDHKWCELLKKSLQGKA